MNTVEKHEYEGGDEVPDLAADKSRHSSSNGQDSLNVYVIFFGDPDYDPDIDSGPPRP